MSRSTSRPMQSKATFLGYAVHPSLLMLPLGMLSAAVALDLMGLVAGGAGPMIAGASYWVLAMGLVAALAAAPFGLFDVLAVSDRRRAGRLQALGHLIVAGLFVASWLLRRDSAPPTALALALSFGGASIALGSTWFGSGIADGAPVDSPSSLDHSHQPTVEPR